jgi:hypothetical protein
MSIFDKLFPNPLPKELSHAARQEAEHLIMDLIGVGKKDGYLSEHPGGQFDFHCHNLEARRIGQRLNVLGGLALMQAARERIRRKLGMMHMSHLDYAWSDIGKWKP